MNYIIQKLDPKDRIIFSTLSKETRRWSDQFPKGIHDVMIRTAETMLSFSTWLREHGALLERLSIATNFTPFSNALPAFLAGACPMLHTLSLDVPSHDSAALMLMSSHLQHLRFSLSGYIEHTCSLNYIEFPSLQTLCIEGRSHKVVLPHSFESLSHLRMEKCRVHALPEMHRLKNLELPYCMTHTEVFESLAHCTMLTRLDLTGNGMYVVPDSVSFLTQLEELDLKCNQLTSYDENSALFEDTLLSLNELTTLRELNVSHNYLDNIGMEELAKLTCTNLRRLDVSCNPCTNIPPGPYLTHLNVLRTSCIPSCLGTMRCLEEVHLHGHCARHQPYEEHWVDIESITVPPHLDTLYVDDDDKVNVRLVHDMFDLVKRAPRLSMKVNAVLS